MPFQLSEKDKLLLEHHLPDTFFAFITAFIEKIHHHLLDELNHPPFLEAYLKEREKYHQKLMTYLYESELVHSWINFEKYVNGEPAAQVMDQNPPIIESAKKEKEEKEEASSAKSENQPTAIPRQEQADSYEEEENQAQQVERQNSNQNRVIREYEREYRRYFYFYQIHHLLISQIWRLKAPLVQELQNQTAYRPLYEFISYDITLRPLPEIPHGFEFGRIGRNIRYGMDY